MKKTDVVGYVINTELVQTKELDRLNTLIKQQFPNAWLQPQNTQHVTLMDWLAPLVDYGKDKDEIFSEIQSSYTSALREILRDEPKITIHFNQVKISGTAVYIEGHDGGVFNIIRQAFLKKIHLIEGTKPPATIVHSTLARFTEPPFEKVINDFVTLAKISSVQEVETFRLVRETTSPMLEYKVIDEFHLG